MAYHLLQIIIGIVEILIFARFIFKLLGANITGFVAWLYRVTEPLVAPFYGIFAARAFETGVIEFASLLALVAVAIIGSILATLIRPARTV